MKAHELVEALVVTLAALAAVGPLPTQQASVAKSKSKSSASAAAPEPVLPTPVLEKNLLVLDEFINGISNFNPSNTESSDIIYEKIITKLDVLDDFLPSIAKKAGLPVDTSSGTSPIFSLEKLTAAKETLKKYIWKHPFRFISVLFTSSDNLKSEASVVQRTKFSPSFADGIAIFALKKIFKLILKIFGKSEKIGRFVLKIVEKLQKADGGNSLGNTQEDSLNWLGLDSIPPPIITSSDTKVQDVALLEGNVAKSLLGLIASVSKDETAYEGPVGKIQVVFKNLQDLIVGVRTLLERINKNSISGINLIDLAQSSEKVQIDSGKFYSRTGSAESDGLGLFDKPLNLGLLLNYSGSPYDSLDRWNYIQELLPRFNRTFSTTTEPNVGFKDDDLSRNLEMLLAGLDLKGKLYFAGNVTQATSATAATASTPSATTTISTEQLMKMKKLIAAFKLLLTNLPEVRPAAAMATPADVRPLNEVSLKAESIVDELASILEEKQILSPFENLNVENKSLPVAPV